MPRCFAFALEEEKEPSPPALGTTALANWNSPEEEEEEETGEANRMTASTSARTYRGKRGRVRELVTD